MTACAVVAVSSSCNFTPEWHGVHRSISETENVWHPPLLFLSCFHVFVLHQYGLVAQKLGFHFHVHCLLHVFIFHRLAPEEYLSEHFSPCTSIQILDCSTMEKEMSILSADVFVQRTNEVSESNRKPYCQICPTKFTSSSTLLT